ncbi:hypothetical protein OIU34_24715 [Pararhizobium sp. BT-229]|uniref:hypothetical protein n=1 Tax=Pararhizobium sp. BT-229 TaxID=2986923 RepID=UPI0021F7A786|nr:hypothetical protein [Pararhizobium sp. BT-229]MCV9965105.1 hypothetical protein [Pararhizobium sp. BT-229]
MSTEGKGTAEPKSSLGRKAIVYSFVLLLVGCLAWISIPLATKAVLEYRLGHLPFAKIIADAEARNTKSISSISEPRLIIDIPSAAAVPALKAHLVKAIDDADVPKEWKLSRLGDPTVTFIPEGIRVFQKVAVKNEEWGQAEIGLTAVAVPSYLDGKLSVQPTLEGASVSSMDIKGFSVPWIITSSLEAAVLGSVSNINQTLKSFSLDVPVPEQLVQKGLTDSVILVGESGISVMVGTHGANPTSSGKFADAFLATARRAYPEYKPGAGVIAVANTGRDFKSDTEKLRADSIAANLAAAIGILGVPADIDPTKIDLPSVSSLALVSASPQWLEATARNAIIDAIKNIKGDIVLDIPDANVTAKVVEGAIEVAASGSAQFMDGQFSADFSVTAWGATFPSATGIQARYALRELKISRVSVKWEGMDAKLTVPYEQALGELASSFIATKPSDIVVPKIPLKVDTSQDGAFKIVTDATDATVELRGRSLLLSPRRIGILVAPKIGGDTPFADIQSVNSVDAFQRFDALMARVEALLNDGPVSGDASVLVAKPALSSLIQTAFAKLNPRVEGNLKTSDTSPSKEIEAIPGDASCGNPCGAVSSCGDIGSCTISVCEDVIVGQTCARVCPRFVPGCDRLCKNVTKQVCGSQTDSSCTSRINSCTSGITECAAKWTSGLQATCEVAMAAIKGTDFRGVANVGATVSVDASGKTAKDARLVISPALDAVDLTMTLSGSATVDASVDITWTDWGNLFLCPSGQLSSKFTFSIPETAKTLHADLSWHGGTDTPLVATIAPAKLGFTVAADEPPLQTLVKSNPGLMTCSLGRVITGLGVATMPKITGDLIANALRGAIRGDNGKLAAALIDGKYSREEELKPFDVTVPDTTVNLLGDTRVLRPSMGTNALRFAMQ